MLQKRRLRKKLKEYTKRYNQNWAELYSGDSSELHNQILKLKREQLCRRITFVQKQLDDLNKGKKADVKASA